MGTVPPISAKINLDITDWLNGTSKAGPAMAQMASDVQNAISKMNAEMAKQVEAMEEVGEQFEKLKNTHRGAYASMQGDMGKSVQMYLMLDRTFRVGLDREMYAVMAAFPVFQKFLALLYDVPAVTPLLLSAMLLKSGIEELIKVWKQASEAAGNLAREEEGLLNAGIAETDSLKVQSDQLDITIAKFEHKPVNYMALAIDEDRQKMDQLVSSFSSGFSQIDAMLKDSSAHIGWVGASLGTVINAAKDFVDWINTGKDKPLTIVHTDTAQLESIKKANDRLKELTVTYGISTGEALANNEAIDASAAATKYDVEMTAALKDEIKKLSAERNNLQTFGPDWKMQYDELGTAIARYGMMLNNFTQEQKNTDKENQARLDQEAKENLTLAQQIEKAKLDAWKKTELDKIDATEAAAKKEFDLGRTTQEQLTIALQTAINARADIEKKYLANELAMVGKNVDKQNEIYKIQAEQKDIPLKRQTSLGRVDVEVEDAARKRLAIEFRMLDAKQRINAIEASSELEHSKIMLGMHRETAEENFAIQRSVENRSWQSNRDMLLKKIGDLGPANEKTKDEITTLFQQLEALDKEHVAKDQAIRDAAQEEEYNKEQSYYQSVISLQESRAQRELDLAIRKNTGISGSSSKKQYEAQRAAIETWHNQELSLITGQMHTLEAEQKTGTQEYIDLINQREAKDAEYYAKLDALEKKEHQAWKKLQEQMKSEFNNTIDLWLKGQGRMSTNWRNMLDQMGLSVSNMLLQWVEKEAAAMIKNLALHEMHQIELTMVTAQGEATRAAIEDAHSLKAIFHLANEGAARAWSKHADNPIIGAALAAGTWAAIMAYAMFEKGGVVGGYGFQYSNEVPILATPGERVLTVDQTNKFHQMVDSHREGGSDKNVHFHYSPSIQGIDGASVQRMAQNHGRVWERQTHHMLRVKGLVQ
jgi:hypothetical protein